VQAQSLPQAYALSFCAQERLAGGTVRNMCFFRFLWIYFESLGRCDSVSTCVRDSVIQDELSQEHQAEVFHALLLMPLLIACLLFVVIVVIENVSSLTVGLCAV
jgi:hypothetical protein